MAFFAQKTPDFGPKNRLWIWGVPPSPPLRIFFGEKGVTDLGGTPPPFMDKIRKVVFEGLPYEALIYILTQSRLNNSIIRLTFEYLLTVHPLYQV